MLIIVAGWCSVVQRGLLTWRSLWDECTAASMLAGGSTLNIVLRSAYGLNIVLNRSRTTTMFPPLRPGGLLKSEVSFAPIVGSSSRAREVLCLPVTAVVDSGRKGIVTPSSKVSKEAPSLLLPVIFGIAQ